MKFAETQVKRGKAKKPAIVGALIQLGNCFDLMDTRFTDELAIAYSLLERLHDETGDPLPNNQGNTPDRKLRKLDCAVLNLYFESLENDGEAPAYYDSVRCGFVEGEPAFPGSGIRHQSHVQLAIRNPGCVVGCSAHNEGVSSNKPAVVQLDPNAPGLDDETRKRRRVLAKMQRMTGPELRQVAVRAGICTESGKLTEHYREDAEPSASRPTD